jgi:hypothetical protein
MWTVKTNPITGSLDVIRYDGEGTAVRRWPLGGAAMPQAMHTVTQTRDWLVLVDTAFRIDPGELMGGERTVTNNTDEPVFLVRKDALEATPHGQPVPPRCCGWARDQPLLRRVGRHRRHPAPARAHHRHRPGHVPAARRRRRLGPTRRPRRWPACTTTRCTTGC